MKKVLLVLLATMVAIPLFAHKYDEIVYLKNGSEIHGTVIEQIPGQSLKIQTRDGNIFVYKYSDIEKLYESVASIFSGYSTGGENANNTFGRISKRINAVKSKTKDEKAVNAVILLNDGIAAPKGTLYDEMLTVAGGKNIAGKQYSINYAEIVKKNPQHIFCPADMVESVKSDKTLAKTDAVKNGNVTAFSPLYFERYGENFALGVEIMASALHPDLVKSPIR